MISFIKQLAVLGVHDPQNVKPIKMGWHPWVKPSEGGLWTSTFIPPTNGKYASSWIEWCYTEMPEWIKNKKTAICYVLESARIYHIDSLQDLVTLVNTYPSKSDYPYESYPNWIEVSKDYDAVHLTEKGQRRTRLTTPGLYGWDCESTLWFRNQFGRVVPYYGKLVRSNSHFLIFSCEKE